MAGALRDTHRGVANPRRYSTHSSAILQRQNSQWEFDDTVHFMGSNGHHCNFHRYSTVLVMLSPDGKLSQVGSMYILVRDYRIVSSDPTSLAENRKPSKR